MNRIGFGLALLGTLLIAPAIAAEPPVRDIYVPLEALQTLLEAPSQRVLLTPEQYEALVKKARSVPKEKAPHEVVLLSADYQLTVEDDRARISGTLVLEVLAEGLHAVPLTFDGVSIRLARLDGEPADIARSADGTHTLFVEGQGRHRLALEIITPVDTTAAQQLLGFHLPHAAATRLRATVPGNVEIKQGPGVISREVDDRSGLTRFELLPADEAIEMAFSLSNRQRRQQRVVIARAAFVDVITTADERLHATISLAILYRPVDRFELAIPEGFEVLDVQSPQLAH